MLTGVNRATAILMLIPLLAGCNALKEYEGEPPPPRPDIALDCRTVASATDILGGPIEPGSATSVAQRFLARHGLEPGDELELEHGPWEPGYAGVRVTRDGRTVGSVELERETGGWTIRAHSLCDDFYSAG